MAYSYRTYNLKHSSSSSFAVLIAQVRKSFIITQLLHIKAEGNLTQNKVRSKIRHSIRAKSYHQKELNIPLRLLHQSMTNLLYITRSNYINTC